MSSFSGILEIEQPRLERGLHGRKHGFVRSVSLTLSPTKSDIFVPPSIISKYNLRQGALVSGTAIIPSQDRSNRNKMSPEVRFIERVNEMDPEKWKNVREFSGHEAVSPSEVIRLEGPGSDPAMRVVDLFCPLGKGQRALIVSPPKAGKTVLLQQIAQAINVNYPEIELIVLLIDERPEEVTDMRRSIKGEVFASSNDSDHLSHVRLAQLVPEYAKRKVETGKDVVLLLDSLTRLGRAFNTHQKSSGRTMSGGVDIRALEIPKRIFGAARKLEDGGSLTIVATVLVDTNSRMDELIFQEFKGTGNMELVLDRDLANERIFPAINLSMSGTRREELLFGADVQQYQMLRRSIARMSPRDAMQNILKLVRRYPSNDKILLNF
ncbi:MAG: transcription termination factor Rho [Bacteroidetes bacterium]|nr:transcription termination factor Rho [Bacteroidota bacterium]